MSRGDLTKMNKQNKSNWKKVAAVAGAALLVGLTAGAVAHPFSTSQAAHDEAVSLARSEAFNNGVASVDLIVCAAPVEVIKEVEVIVEVPTEVIKMVPDMETERALCDRLMFDDASDCIKEVKAEDSALELAWKELESELSDDSKHGFLEDLVDEGIIQDEDEVSIVKMYTDFDQIEILESDFDDNKYEFLLKAKLDDDEANEKVKVLFNVVVEDGEAEIVDYNIE